MNENVDQNPTPQSTPTDLVSLVLGDAAAKGAAPASAEPPVDKIGNVPVTEFMPALEQATGFKSLDEVKALREQAAALDEYKRKVSELESRPVTPKYASEFVARLDQLVASGADQAKVSAYWTLANANIEAMEPIDILVMQKSLANPGISPDAIRAYVLSENGLDGEDVDLKSLPPAKLAQIQIKANEAKGEIAKERVAFETAQPKPDGSAEANQMRQVQGQAAAPFWGEVLSQLPATINYRQDPDAEKNIQGYEFNFNPRPEVVTAARQAMIQAVAQNPDMYPKTKEGAGAMHRDFLKLVEANSLDDFKRAMFLDMSNSIMQEFVRRNAGPVPNHIDPPRPNESKSKLPAIMDLVKGKAT